MTYYNLLVKGIEDKTTSKENTDEIQMEAPMPERENEDVIKEK